MREGASVSGAGLSVASAGTGQRRLAIAAVILSLALLPVIGPYAGADLAHAPAVTPVYEAALCVIDLITAILLFGEFYRVRAPALAVLASGYLFCSLMSVLFTLSFPEVFAPEGLVGGPQSSAWTWMLWRAVFPLFVLAYALMAGKGPLRTDARTSYGLGLTLAIGGTLALFGLITFVVAREEAFLPPVMVSGDFHRTLALGLSPALIVLDLIALAAMWRRRNASVLDLWVMVTLAAWFCDVCMSGVFDSHRYDLGWYAGRIYGLFAAGFVLTALLTELNKLYSRLAESLALSERQNEELLRSREELGRVQRLEALVQLTGGVAHDFNNLLTAIIGGLDMIRRKPEDADRVARLSANAAKAAARGAELIKRMLSFARKQNLKPEVLNPNAILMEFEDFATRAAGEAVIVDLELDSAIHPVRVDATELQAAVLNLVTNARDAMPGGGTVRVASRNLELVEGDAARDPNVPSGLKAGDYVQIVVEDEGCGMDAATLARVFEPFFTTKPTGQGTGLGLSQVYGFARDADGRVDIDSEPGQGTRVTITLPRSELGVRPAEDLPITEGLPLRQAQRGETVLVVEDDTDVIASARESLMDLGYKVLLAANAREALDILERKTRRVDILFSDVVMPGGMNGVQLAVEARRLRPDLKVLLTSGYADAVLREHDIPANTPLLSKPYQRDELAQKIRLVLGA
jgi:signal transduction histidine kinase/CheY-like chemotaxis protein